MSAQRTPEAHHPERLDRKALKGPDEFVVWTNRVASWAQANRSVVMALAGLAGVAVLGAALYAWQAARTADAAAEAFRVASASFTAGKYADAATAYEALATEHPATAFGRLALLYRGHCLAREGKPAEAAVAYEEFLSHAPDAAYLRQLALASQGRAYEASGNATAAREAFGDAAELSGPYRVDALLSYARLAEAAGDQGVAQDAYRKVLDENPDPETLAFVQRKVPQAAGTTGS